MAINNKVSLELKAIDNMSPELRKVQGAVKRTWDKLKAFWTASVNASRSFATFAWIIWWIAVAGLTTYWNTVQGLDWQLLALKWTQEEANKQFESLVEIANKSRAPLETTIKAFSRFERANLAIGWSTEETEIMIENLNKRLAITWATAEETSSLMLQLSQWFWAWYLSWEEFNAVADAMPSLLEDLAKSLGVSRGALKEMGSEWKITSQIIKDTLIDTMGDVNATFEKMPATIWQSITIFKNTFLQWLKEINDWTWIFNKVSEAISKVTEKFQEIVPKIVEFMNWLKVEDLKLIGWVILWAVAPAFIALWIAIGGAMIPLLPFMAAWALIATNWWGIAGLFVNIKTSVEDFVNLAVLKVTEFWAATTEKFNAIKTSLQEFWDKFWAVISWIWITITSMFLPKLLTMTAVTVAELWKQALAWTIWAWKKAIALTATVIPTIKTYLWRLVAMTAKTVISWVKMWAASLKNAKRMALALTAAIWPVWLVIGAIVGLWVVIYKNWDKIVWYTKQKWAEFSDIIWKAMESVKNIIFSYISQAKTWWWNMIDMFKKGVMGKFNAFKDSILWVAKTIKSVLWFASPTDEWPASNSDKWMPNMMNMFIDWINKEKPKFSKAVTEIAESIQSSMGKIEMDGVLANYEANYEWVASVLEKLKWEFSVTFRDIENNIAWSENKIKSLKNEIESLQWKLWESQNKSQESEDNAKIKIAERLIKIQDELASGELEWEKRLMLEKELAQGKAVVSEKEIYDLRKQQLEEASRTEIEKLILAESQKQMNFAAEQSRIQQEIFVKQEALKVEQEQLEELNSQKMLFEQNYHALYMENLTKRNLETGRAIQMQEKLIALMKKSGSGWGSSQWWIDWARALWWPVTWGWTYLVWERWPELFTPRQSWQIVPNNQLWWAPNININMGWVTVKNEADENRLLDKIKKTLIMETRNYNLWIS